MQDFLADYATQVSHAGLSSLPVEVANLTNLTSLVLKGNQVAVK